MKKYDKIRGIGNDENAGILDGGEIVVTEKLDGANFRFMLEGHLEDEYHVDGRDIVFGSRNVVWKNEKDIPEAFEHAVEYVREHLKPHVLKLAEHQAESPIVMFGEAMHPHTLDYDWNDVESFYGHGVYHVDTEEYVHDPRTLFSNCGLEYVPTLYVGDPSEWDAPEPEDMIQSAFRDGEAEGVVVRNTETGQVAKLRSEKIPEIHGTPQADDNEYNESDGGFLARKYTTEARVMKMVHKMRDEGHEVHMGMMEGLWRRVFDDIVEEAYEDIFLSNYVIDTKEFRSEVANECARWLRVYIERPEESALNEK